MSRTGHAEDQNLSQGTGGHRGGFGSPALWRGRAPRGRPAAKVRAPGQARTGYPPQRPDELAARNASGHEHQGDEAKPTTP